MKENTNAKIYNYDVVPSLHKLFVVGRGGQGANCNNNPSSNSNKNFERLRAQKPNWTI